MGRAKAKRAPPHCCRHCWAQPTSYLIHSRGRDSPEFRYARIRKSRGGKSLELSSRGYSALPWLLPQCLAPFDANRQVPDLIAPDIFYPGREDLILHEKAPLRTPNSPTRFDRHLSSSTTLHILSQGSIVTSGHTRRKDGQHCTYSTRRPHSLGPLFRLTTVARGIMICSSAPSMRGP